MRVLMVCKACIVGIYQRKLELMARHGVELVTVVPPSWRDERGETPLERVYTDGYRLQTLPLRFNGSFHLHHYVGLRQQIDSLRPDIVHIDEEPYNLATWQTLFQARRAGAKTVAFTWQNIARAYPPPFNWGERWTLTHIDHLIAGTDSAAQVWRDKGYRGDLTVVPQFGTDAALFHPLEKPPHKADGGAFTVGYVGRLVPEKGLTLLLDAVAKLNNQTRLLLVGGGPLESALRVRAVTLGISEQVEFAGLLPSTAMPAQYQRLDALVLPSWTMSNWKEQFGRVLIEAMASGVPVIGSDSGAIPDVIGSAGLVVPERNVDALAAALRSLQTSPTLYADLRESGRARVLAHFTHEQVAAATVAVYRHIVEATPPRQD